MSRLVREPFHPDERPFRTIARNVSGRYAAILVDALIGLLMLPFNVTHLGTSAYGLWMLTASLTVHFSILDLGYGGALVKFIAQYRASRSVQALNEIASTLFFVFAAVGALAYAVAFGLALNLDSLFRITPEQAETACWVLLIIAVQVALNFPFSVYGGIVAGFQRHHVNAVVAIATSIAVALVNVAVLTAGFGLVGLVLAVTSVRVLAFFAYASNAHRTYPALRIRPALFRLPRLREVTGFSIYASLIDWANKLNYQFDQLVIGAFLGPASVAIWAVAERIVSATQSLTNQLNGVLFPLVVDSDATERRDRLQQILVQGTRLSLASVLPVAAALVALADPIVRAWVPSSRPELLGSVPVLQVLAVAVAIRVGNATGTTLLKGAGRHRMLAFTNITTGVANVALSVLLVRTWGLVGVAIGTLIPIAFSSFVVLYPAACRRVGLGPGAALRRAVWPALWPALVVAAGLFALREISSGTVLAVVSLVGTAGLVYLLLFLLAIGARDRAVYAAQARELLGRTRVAPAA